MEILETGFEDSMTVSCVPEHLQKKLRTTNHLERLNRELKRRSDVIQVFPNAESVLRLMGAVTMEINNSFVVGNCIYARKTMDELRSDAFPKLRKIALDQLAILKAA
jgi:putative transposase